MEDEIDAAPVDEETDDEPVPVAVVEDGSLTTTECAIPLLLNRKYPLS